MCTYLPWVFIYVCKDFIRTGKFTNTRSEINHLKLYNFAGIHRRNNLENTLKLFYYSWNFRADSNLNSNLSILPYRDVTGLGADAVLMHSKLEKHLLNTHSKTPYNSYDLYESKTVEMLIGYF